MKDRVSKEQIKEIEYFSAQARYRIETGYIGGNVVPCRDSGEGIIEKLIRRFNLKVA